MSTGLTRLMAVLMASLAFAGCIGGESNPTDDTCPEDSSDPSDSAMDESMDAQNESQSNEAGNESTMDTRLMRQASEEEGNETGNETLPEDNEHGEIAESGPADGCPAENPVDSEETEEMADNFTEESEDVIERTAFLEASRSSGEAPLTVTFTGSVNADATDSQGDSYAVDPGNFAWSITFTEDGEPVTGDQSSETITAEFTYEAAGEYVATFEVTFEDGEVVTDQATVTVAEPKPMPEQTFFEFGPGPGCAGDAGPDGCLSYHVGDSGPFVDAVWIPLDESYVGWSFTSTVGNARGDSDGWLMDADHNVIVDVNGGGTQALGTVVPGSAWLFIFSYAEPHTGMTVTFTPPS